MTERMYAQRKPSSATRSLDGRLAVRDETDSPARYDFSNSRAWVPAVSIGQRLQLSQLGLHGTDVASSSLADSSTRSVGDYLLRSGSGFPIPTPLRQRLEASYGEDLSSVQLTSDERATQNLGATAFSIGSRIVLRGGPVFAREEFATLAHEVAHVIQHRRVPPGTHQLKPESSVDDSAEIEAARASEAVIAGQRLSIQARPGGIIQRRSPEASAMASARVETEIGLVKNAYNGILHDRTAEINRLAAEVQKPIVEEPDLVEEIMLAAVKAAVGNVTSAIAEKIATKLYLSIETGRIESEVEKTLASSFNKGVTSGLEEALSKSAKEGYSAAQKAVREKSSQDVSPSGSVFIELQTKALNGQFKAMMDNIDRQRVEFIASELKTPGAGVAAVDKVKQAVDFEYAESQEDELQFKESLSAWMNYLAVASLGKYTPTTRGEKPGSRLGADAILSEAPGVLRVRAIFPPDPAKPVEIAEVRVAGLQESLRRELQNRPIASLGVSIVLESVFGWDPWMISRNEGGTVFFQAPQYDRDRFVKYLSTKAGRGDQPSEEAAFAGARRVIEQEVGPHEIKKAMSPGETVWSRVPPEMTSWPPSR